MLDPDTQISALLSALTTAGFSPVPDMKHGDIALNSLPEFTERPAFALTIVMDEPFSKNWQSLFEGCILESGRMVKGAAHRAAMYSRKKAVERARQEKWVALWSLYDAGILPEEQRPVCDNWQDVTLP